jgi:hypothetical protein
MKARDVERLRDAVAKKRELAETLGGLFDRGTA